MKSRESELQFLFILSDLLLLNAVFLMVYLLGGFQIRQGLDIYLSLIVGSLAWLLAHLFVRKQIIYLHKGFRFRLYRVIRRSGVFFILTVILFAPLYSLLSYLLVFFITSVLAFSLVKVASSYVFFNYLKWRGKRSNNLKRTLLIGYGPVMKNVKNLIKSNPILGYRYVGFLTKDDEAPNRKALGSIAQLGFMAQQHGIQAVFAAVDNRTLNDPGHDPLLRQCNQLGVRLYYVPREAPVATGSIQEERLNGLIIYNPQRIPLDIPENQVLKRIFDLVFSSFVIVAVLSWLYPLMALLIKLSSPGPVLFRQLRTGVNQRQFECYKFRSMRPNVDADRVQATRDDPRITAIGRFMRRTNIDEMPQFLNVWRGDMSVVGPRPHMISHTEQYSELIDHYLVRHYVRPGITGWAQISGLRGETSELWMMRRRVEADWEYIRNWTLEWDILIVLKTIFNKRAFKNAG